MKFITLVIMSCLILAVTPGKGHWKKKMKCNGTEMNFKLFKPYWEPCKDNMKKTEDKAEMHDGFRAMRCCVMKGMGTVDNVTHTLNTENFNKSILQMYNGTVGENLKIAIAPCLTLNNTRNLIDDDKCKRYEGLLTCKDEVIKANCVPEKEEEKDHGGDSDD